MIDAIQIPIRCTCKHLFVHTLPKIADLTIDCVLVRIIEDEDVLCPSCGSRIGVFVDIETVEHKKAN